MVTEELKETLRRLAVQFETPEFINQDPSKFMHGVTDTVEQELTAFLSANLAFGRRDQILKHIEKILDAAGNKLHKWILEKEYRNFFTEGDRSFYRVYTHNSMLSFFDTIEGILVEHQSLGNCFRNLYLSAKESNPSGTVYLSPLISTVFPADCTLIPHGKDTAAKKVNMFLRWMVRSNSPVDLGLWADWYPKKDLLIPLDTHVMQESTRLGLLDLTPSGKIPSATMKTAQSLSRTAESIFPGDPARLDYALFGLGVSQKTQESFPK